MGSALILEFDGVGANDYGAVNAALGIDMSTGSGDWPEGMRSHIAGTTDAGGLIVVEVWDSQEAQARFMESRLGPALASCGIPAPSRMNWTDLLAHHAL